MVFRWMGSAILGGCTMPAILFVLTEMASFRADFVFFGGGGECHSNDVSLNSRN